MKNRNKCSKNKLQKEGKKEVMLGKEERKLNDDEKKKILKGE